jgi:hypothetical protein
MSHGEDFAKLLTRALKDEEEELRDLSTKAVNSRQTVKSVKEYYEQWLNVPLVKEALRTSSVPQLDWEKNRVDVKFLDNKRSTVATFEIKFENVPLNPHGIGEIEKDLKKQCKAALSDNGNVVEHYCVLVLCGTRDIIEGWRPTEMQGFLEGEYPSIQLTVVPCPEFLKLNDDGYLGVFTMRVASA